MADTQGHDVDATERDMNVSGLEVVELDVHGSVGFDGDDYVVGVVPTSDADGVVEEGDVVAMVGVAVKELDVLNYAMRWWPEVGVVVGVMLAVVSAMKLWKWRRYRRNQDDETGGVCCRKCGYDLRATKGSKCNECEAADVGEGDKNRVCVASKWSWLLVRMWRGGLVVGLVMAMLLGGLQVYGIEKFDDQVSEWLSDGQKRPKTGKGWRRRWRTRSVFASEWLGFWWSSGAYDVAKWLSWRVEVWPSRFNREEVYAVEWRGSGLEKRLVGDAVLQVGDRYYPGGGASTFGNENACAVSAFDGGVLFFMKRAIGVEVGGEVFCVSTGSIKNDEDATPWEYYLVDERYLVVLYYDSVATVDLKKKRLIEEREIRLNGEEEGGERIELLCELPSGVTMELIKEGGESNVVMIDGVAIDWHLKGIVVERRLDGERVSIVLPFNRDKSLEEIYGTYVGYEVHGGEVKMIPKPFDQDVEYGDEIVEYGSDFDDGYPWEEKWRWAWGEVREDIYYKTWRKMGVGMDYFNCEKLWVFDDRELRKEWIEREPMMMLVAGGVDEWMEDMADVDRRWIWIKREHGEGKWLDVYDANAALKRAEEKAQRDG
ncbi:hypothetical protein [Poriferisphaera sp. WC338]|uniref:hypothetical protein n=1 Tax=Poriferisphaera sp. WC338 TaxID=3425129 RepID=UPI003D812B5F